MTELGITDVGSAMGTLPIGLGSASGVYFLKAMGYVKIGYTGDFYTRYSQIDRMMPESPEVLAFIAAPRSLETTIHRLLRDHQLKNEWYPHNSAVGAVMEDAKAGKIDATHLDDAGFARPLDIDVKWASDALKLIAAPIGRDEPIRLVITRTALKVGLRYWRAFDLWYAKARRLETSEKEAIFTALGVLS